MGLSCTNLVCSKSLLFNVLVSCCSQLPTYLPLYGAREADGLVNTMKLKLIVAYMQLGPDRIRTKPDILKCNTPTDTKTLWNENLCYSAAQAISHKLQRPGFNPRSVRMVHVVTKVAMELVFWFSFAIHHCTKCSISYMHHRGMEQGDIYCLSIEELHLVPLILSHTWPIMSAVATQKTVVACWMLNTSEICWAGKVHLNRINVLSLGPQCLNHYFLEDTACTVLFREMGPVTEI
jgi:hypothetical protein